MSSPERFVVLGLSTNRAPWFRELAAAASSGAVPIELLKCVSTDEVADRLRSGRSHSALIIDGGAPGLDRDLVAAAAAAGCAVIVVGQLASTALAVDAVVDRDVRPGTLCDLLARAAQPVSRADVVRLPQPEHAPRGARHPLVAVTGPGGTGASTIAMGLAQALARAAVAGASPGPVLLADLCLDADLAMLHGTGDVIPGLPELVEAHRNGEPSDARVRALTFVVEARGYELLLGLRRHRDWVSLRRRATQAAVDGLRHTYGTVVVDVDADVEGHAETGAIELDDRNVLARHAHATADVVVVVGTPGLRGVHALSRCLRALIDLGVDPERLVPVINHAPRGLLARREITQAVREQVRPVLGRDSDLMAPLFVPTIKGVEGALHAASSLPGQLAAEIAKVVIDRRSRHASAAPEPELIRPGSFGAFELYEEIGA